MDRRTLLMGGAAAAVVAAGGLWLNSTRTPALPSIATVTPASGDATDTSGIVEMTLGAEDAPVTLTEYASFTCPHCANFHGAVFKDLKRDYIDTGKVKFVYRDVYFDQFGLWAAMIARCEPTRFFGISDMLYDQQKQWIGDGNPAGIAERLRKIGRIAGLESEQMEACLADEDQARALVGWFQKNATEDDVTGTPTLFINGEKHSNMNYNDLKALLDAALES
ncbi:DsbA family protein [Pseudooceanicola onchidii]|uniref:DsbA family protein n=1 Tax=Pseudooceanicola onchidii TaxID=2562279 RepID=UPI0010AA0A75|nr:DsbA family protein [Pseudooceanicola onchidii]